MQLFFKLGVEYHTCTQYMQLNAVGHIYVGPASQTVAEH